MHKSIENADASSVLEDICAVKGILRYLSMESSAKKLAGFVC